MTLCLDEAEPSTVETLEDQCRVPSESPGKLYVTLAGLFFIWLRPTLGLFVQGEMTRMVTSSGQEPELSELQARFPSRKVWVALCAAGASAQCCTSSGMVAIGL